MNRLVREFRGLLRLDVPPRRIALAFAIGVFNAFSPPFGHHTLACFVLSWAFRLPLPALLAGSLVNNPWTFTPIYAACLWVGLTFWPLDPTIAPLDWSSFSLVTLPGQLVPYLIPFILGCLLLGAGVGLVAYAAAVIGVTALRRQPTAGDL